MRENELTKRLAVLANFAQNGKIAADIGADHAALSLYLLQTDKFEKVIISDVHKAPLERARGVIEKNGFASRTEFYLTDGIKELPEEISCFFIAGMGGETIADILLKGIDNVRGKEIVLQPMSKEDRLRKILSENGFEIISETVLSENGKLFVAMKVVYTGIKQEKTYLHYLLGECNLDKKDTDTLLYIEKIYNRSLREREFKAEAKVDTSTEDMIISQIEEKYQWRHNENRI